MWPERADWDSKLRLKPQWQSVVVCNMSANTGSRSSSPEIAPRNSFDSLAETAGPDLIVDILQKERQRQRRERFGPAVRFLDDDWDEFLPEFVTDVNRSKTRQERLESEASQKLRKPLTWNVTVQTDGVLEVDASGQARVMALFLHEPQQPGAQTGFSCWSRPAS